MKDGFSQEQVAAAIARIKDNTQFYADDELNFLIESSIPTNVRFVGTAVSSVEGQLANAIQEFTESDATALVAPIHINGNHFVGLYIQRVEDGFHIFYIDPTGRNTIPVAVNRALSEVFEGDDIAIVTTNIIQRHLDGAVTNVHCGAFTAEILTSLARDEMRIVEGRLQGRVLAGDGERAFEDIGDYDEKKSNEYGKLLRKKHSKLIGDDLQRDLQIIEQKTADLLITTPKPLSPKTTEESDASNSTPDTYGSDLDTTSSSPDSSDAEYGAKTLMRKISNRVKDIKVVEHRVGNTRLPEVTEVEIRANPEKYYVANFRGDYLNYFDSNSDRREFVKKRVDGTQRKAPVGYQSQAITNIAAQYEVGSLEYDEEVEELKTPEKLKDIKGFVTGYKSSTHFGEAVQKASPTYGNPVISTSKDTKVVPKYSDHPKTGAILHPKYDDKKPKHRLIGMSTVVVHEALEYIDAAKADIEKLRQEGKIGGKSAVERDNQEIMFSDEIKSEHIAGYVPLAYPNLSEKYSDEDQKLFGLNKLPKMPQTTRTAPKSLGDGSKVGTIYAANQEFQWQLAEKFVKEKNPNGELLWVDNYGKFRRFVEDGLEKKTVAEIPHSSPLISRTKSSSSEDEIPTKQFSIMKLASKDGKGK